MFKSMRLTPLGLLHEDGNESVELTQSAVPCWLERKAFRYRRLEPNL